MAAPTRTGRTLRGTGRLALQALGTVAVLLAFAAIATAVTVAVRADKPSADTAAVVTISNSKAGTPIVSAADLAPGRRRTGTVRIGNRSTIPVSIELEQDPVRDDAGAGGGRLSSSLQLRIDDLGAGAGTSTGLIYTGPLSGVRAALPVGTFAPNERRTFRFTVLWPDSVHDEDALQGSSVALGYRWTGRGSFDATSAAQAPGLKVGSRTRVSGRAKPLTHGVTVEATCPAGCTVQSELLLSRRLARLHGIEGSAPADAAPTTTAPVALRAPVAQAARAGSTPAAGAARSRSVVVGTATTRLEQAGRAKLTVHLNPGVRARLRGVARVRLALRSQMFDLSGALQRTLRDAVVFTGTSDTASAATGAAPSASSAPVAAQAADGGAVPTSDAPTSGASATPSADGAGGSVSAAAAPAIAGAPNAGAAGSTSNAAAAGTSAWPWLVAAALLLVGAATVVRCRRRRG